MQGQGRRRLLEKRRWPAGRYAYYRHLPHHQRLRQGRAAPAPEFVPRPDVSLRGDIGCSDAGSRFTWNIRGLAGYRFTLYGRHGGAGLPALPQS